MSIVYFIKIPPGQPGFSIDVETLRKDATINNTASAESGGAGASSSANAIMQKRSVSSDWNLLSQAFDRFLFVIYTLIILIFLATYVGGAANVTADIANTYG